MQIAILLGLARPKRAQAQFDDAAVGPKYISELETQVTAMQELMQKFSQALLHHDIKV